MTSYMVLMLHGNRNSRDNMGNKSNKGNRGNMCNSVVRYWILAVGIFPVR